MTLQSGQSLCHYRLVEKIGEGGMGVVWRATDTTLNRDVAIKVLPEVFAEDADRLARFEREARLLAALNHANIAAIHGLDEADGVRFLVLELVPGEGLDERLKREPMSVERALDIGLQIAEAVESAHESGVIHRDLKPANIKITPEGKVKVLDFGLAKALDPDLAVSSGSDLSHSPTMTTGGTAQGMVLGTAAYMSPEQARGRLLDRRTDIWSFGCLLYECLTGSRVFSGETASDSMAAILRAEPDLSNLPASTPARVRTLLERCLVKDPRNRLRDMGDARLELQQSIAAREWTGAAASDADAQATAAAPSPSMRLVAPLLFLAGLLVGVAIWAGLAGGWGATTPPEPVTRVSLATPDGIIPQFPRLTPDGRNIVFIGAETAGREGEPATSRLYIRRLEEEEPTPLPGTEGITSFDLSPDGTRLAFVAPTARQSSRLQLQHMPLDRSAPPLAVRDWRAGWSAMLWLPGDEIATATEAPSSLLRIPLDGSEPAAPLKLDVEGFNQPTPIAYLGDGRAILANVATWDEEGYQENIAVIDPATGEIRPLVENAQYSALLPSGQLLVSRHDTLLAFPFDSQKLQITGGPAPVMGGLRADNLWVGAWFDLAADGTLVHLPGGLIGLERRLAFLEGNTQVEPWSGEQRAFNERVTLSRDGSRFGVIIANAQQLYEVWISDLATPRLTRFVAEPGMDCYPDAWTADNQSLIYDCSGDDARAGIYMRPVDGSTPPELLLAKGEGGWRSVGQTVAPDESVLLVRRDTESGAEVVLLPMESDTEGQRVPRVLSELGNADSLSFSPEGQWLAYVSDNSGRSEAYIRRFHAGGNLGPETPVSTRGAAAVSWSRATTQPPFDLIVRRPGVGKADSVTVTTEPSFRLSTPEPLLDPGLVKPVFHFISDLPDGRWFGIQRGPTEGDTDRISVVLNWLPSIQERLPDSP